MNAVTNTNQVWKTYFKWAFFVGITFFTIYPLCNWLASRRVQTYPLYTEYELSIPFIPGFIWIYVSMYVLFLTPPFFLKPMQLTALGKQLVSATFFSGIIFLLVPARLGFFRSNPGDGLYSSMYAQLFSVDLPHNLVPSLHVVFSTLIVLAILKATQSLALKVSMYLWLMLLCLSTVFVHQHHMLDVATGLIAAYIFAFIYKTGEKHA